VTFFSILAVGLWFGINILWLFVCSYGLVRLMSYLEKVASGAMTLRVKVVSLFVLTSRAKVLLDLSQLVIFSLSMDFMLNIIACTSFSFLLSIRQINKKLKSKEGLQNFFRSDFTSLAFITDLISFSAEN
jgi:hypothetical protein